MFLFNLFDHTASHLAHFLKEGQWSLGPRQIFKTLAKRVDFLLSKGKKQISPLLDPLQTFLKNPLVAPSRKNPSDTHG